MKLIHPLAALTMIAGMLCSCTSDGGGTGSSEESSIKGSSMVSGFSAGHTFNNGSAFMYKSGQTYYFLLCEGEASSWEKAKALPHLEIHIWEGWIITDPMALADYTKHIDINGSEKKVYVCWVPGNGYRFFDKNNYASAQGNFMFESGSLSVGSVGMDMYTIAFTGRGTDKKDYFEADYSYGGQFSRN